MLARPFEMVLLGGALLGCAYKVCTRQIKTRRMHGLWILRRRELGIMHQVIRLISPHKTACPQDGWEEEQKLKRRSPLEKEL
jgi:hypothetical protein